MSTIPPREAGPPVGGIDLDDYDTDAALALLVDFGMITAPADAHPMSAEGSAEGSAPADAAIVVDDLDARSVLDLAEEALRRRRAAEVDDLLLAAHWADLHATDPRHDPAPQGRWRPPGSDRLVQVGGEDTPMVRELCLPELAIARRTHPLAARRLVADVLDLRHRLPHLWAATLDLRCETWLARRIAGLTRVLPASVCHVVDHAVLDALAHSPAKVLELTAAKIIEADPAGHAARTTAQRHRRYVALTRVDEAGMREVIARLDAGDALTVHATLRRVTEILTDTWSATHTDDQPPPGHDALMAEAFTWLARPLDLAALLLAHASDAPAPDLPPEPQPHTDTEDTEPAPAQWRGPLQLTPPQVEGLLTALRTRDLSGLRPRAVLYLHLHQAAVDGSAPCVARVEGHHGPGPVPLDRLQQLLGHHHVTVTPVLDLADRVTDRKSVV